MIPLPNKKGDLWYLPLAGLRAIQTHVFPVLRFDMTDERGQLFRIDVGGKFSLAYSEPKQMLNPEVNNLASVLPGTGTVAEGVARDDGR